MSTRQKERAKRVRVLDATAIVAEGAMNEMHLGLLKQGFVLTSTAQCRSRQDGSHSVRIVWRRRDNGCSVVVSQVLIAASGKLYRDPLQKQTFSDG